MKHYTCQEGEFRCRVCGAVYPYSDLRDLCEGKPYYIDDPDPRLQVLDRLKAAEGEKVLVTQYHGDDYAPPPYKQGLFLTYRWETVRDRRVVPGIGHPIIWDGKTYRHFAEYRIGEAYPGAEEYGDQWDVEYRGASMAVGYALGPRHVWSQTIVEDDGKKWPDYVIALCAGEKSKDLLRKKKEEGYYISDFEVA